jgi:hypothetical protein
MSAPPGRRLRSLLSSRSGSGCGMELAAFGLGHTARDPHGCSASGCSFKVPCKCQWPRGALRGTRPARVRVPNGQRPRSIARKLASAGPSTEQSARCRPGAPAPDAHDATMPSAARGFCAAARTGPLHRVPAWTCLPSLSSPPTAVTRCAFAALWTFWKVALNCEVFPRKAHLGRKAQAPFLADRRLRELRPLTETPTFLCA